MLQTVQRGSQHKSFSLDSKAHKSHTQRVHLKPDTPNLESGRNLMLQEAGLSEPSVQAWERGQLPFKGTCFLSVLKGEARTQCLERRASQAPLNGCSGSCQRPYQEDPSPALPP
ncbi:hypothetical protein HispidOSU_027206 [Sigmodon hispidus]